MISEEEIAHLAYLCRIECSEEEKKSLASKLDKILEYVKQLSQIDTTGIEPCLHVLESTAGMLREDEEGPTLSTQEFLSNSPSHIGGMIKVPPVLK